MVCVHTCTHVHTPVPLLVYAEVGAVASLYLFLFYPLETVPLNLGLSVLQIGWLASNSQQSSHLHHLPSTGLKSSQGQLFNVSSEHLL